ncbi:UDP-N-acetylmuramoyl-L-alanyl-D-glutamate--2,6-diaminopimelate ligase [Rhodomicrobium lacus]|uniref:UDP-N-acetylmuramoyl-L-alanyl-D-glutamate--2, 6-diaminopimelate ligase n=1 Tax=Rhodomicrobium lacus TaxID=2498452 RepID=UPI003F60BBDF
MAARGLAADTSTAATLEISGLTADSRQVRPGMLFAALAGTKADGMAYAKAAEAAGAVAVLAGETANAEGLSVPVLRAAEPRQALALFAARFYRFQPDTIAAVTGTNGKTSVAAFLRQIWATAGHDAASLGTIGIITNAGERPLSHTTPDPVVLHKTLADLANEGVTHLALEASSHGLDQHRLDGVRFSAGAFTNITRDHLDYHPSFEDYFNAKMRLFRNLLPPGAPAVIDADGDHADDVVGAARARKLDVMTVGEHGAALCLKGVERDGFRQRLSIIYRGRLFTVLLPLAGAFQVSNALVSAGLALGLGSSPGGVFEALETLRGAKGRLDYVGETAEGAPIFVDYAHTPDALVKALEALRPYVTGRLHVVFGCGGDRDRGKRPEMGRAATANADVVYVTDDNPRSEEPAEIRAAIMAAAPGATEIDGRADAIATAIGNLERGDVLLVAGKGHETGQIVGAKVIPYSDHEAVAAALAHIGERRASHG